MNKTRDGKQKSGFLINLIRSSIILSSIDRFTAYIYSLLKNGFFGYIFSGYRNETKSSLGDAVRSTKLAHHLEELRYGICRQIERSFIVNLVNALMKYLLKCRLKVFGAFFIAFGAYNSIIAVVRAIISNSAETLLDNIGFICAFICIFISLPLLFSKKNLSEALVNSLIGRFILRTTGFAVTNPSLSFEARGHSSIAFILGVALALASNAVMPNSGTILVIGGIFGAVLAYIVLIKPEVGVLSLFFFTPLIPTMALAGLVIYTFICWLLKLFRGKRVLRLEPIDIVVMMFAVILLSGGFISLSSGSLQPALLMVCLIFGYFLTVNTSDRREWLIKCTTAIAISGTIVSLYGIFGYYTHVGYYSTAWLDSSMFDGIQNRAVSTLDNPNMLGEYLIIIIPIVLSMLIGKDRVLNRLQSFFCLVSMAVCLVLTWSRGAWIALLVALVFFILMWHYRSIWLIIAGVCSLPVLPYVLPASIISRFTSIGNLSDSSTSYRVYIWRASVKMIGDNPIAGIGIGESAWKRLYPLYSYMGVEAAPHSHNLFLQIWLDLGIFGIIAFMIFVFLLLQAAFTLFRKLSTNSPLRTPDLTESMMRFNQQSSKGKSNAASISRLQLRMSVVGPLVGVIAALIQGFTDYSWYNYRLYLFFWLVAGLCMAYARNGNSHLYQNEGSGIHADAADAVHHVASKQNKMRGGNK